jgi:flavodoxin
VKVLVVFHSKTGNTKKIAEAIARGAGCRAESANRIEGPVEADLLFLGGAVYATHDHDLAPALKAFISTLAPARIKRVVLFRTGFADTAIPIMRRLLAARGIQAEAEHFGCLGHFLVFNLGHPNQADLAAAEEFGKAQSRTLAS